MNSKIIISILIPVYNNVESLSILLEKLKEELDHEFYRYELVLINDGSTDSDYMNLDFKNFSVQIIQLEKNYGQVPAIMTGLKHINGEACVIMAADLQEPVYIINKLIKKWLGNRSLVIAKRESRNDKSKILFLSITFNFLISLFRKELPKTGFDFCIVDLKIIRKIIHINPYTSYLQIKLIDFSDSIKNISYVKNKSFYKKSSWTFLKKVSYANNALFNIDKFIYIKLSFFLTLGIILSVLFIKSVFITLALAVPLLIVALLGFNIILKQKKELPLVKKIITL